MVVASRQPDRQAMTSEYLRLGNRYCSAMTGRGLRPRYHGGPGPKNKLRFRPGRDSAGPEPGARAGRLIANRIWPSAVGVGLYIRVTRSSTGSESSNRRRRPLPRPAACPGQFGIARRRPLRRHGIRACQFQCVGLGVTQVHGPQRLEPAGAGAGPSESDAAASRSGLPVPGPLAVARGSGPSHESAAATDRCRTVPGRVGTGIEIATQARLGLVILAPDTRAELDSELALNVRLYCSVRVTGPYRPATRKASDSEGPAGTKQTRIAAPWQPLRQSQWH